MELFYHEDIPLELITDQFVGCHCRANCSPNSLNCACLTRFSCSYDITSEKLINYDRPIFECNSECQCSKTCPNRVLQRHLSKLADQPDQGNGTYLDLLSSTKTDEIGQTLIALRQLDPGDLVCVYLGEVIPYEEACRRELEQLQTKGHTYVLIMRQYVGSKLVNQICIDGDSDVGIDLKPLTRFINHSCDPNLIVMPVYVDNALPYLALFACQTIQPGSQVTYNYAQSVPIEHRSLSTTRCLCKSSKCMGYLPRA